MKLYINNIEETRALAEKTAALVKGKDFVICLDGDLGAGKTTWTKAFGKALGVKSVINSPTFTILKSYRQADGKPLHHIDAYRLEGIHQDLGFEECFDEGITVIEWGEYLGDQIPADHLSFSLEEGIDENREITITASGPESQKVLEALE